MFDDANMLNKNTVRDVPMNDYVFLNIQAFIYYILEQRLYPIFSSKLQILSSSPNIHKNFMPCYSHLSLF